MGLTLYFSNSWGHVWYIPDKGVRVLKRFSGALPFLKTSTVTTHKYPKGDFKAERGQLVKLEDMIGVRIPYTEYTDKKLSYKAIIKARDGNKCLCCGSTDNLTLDHILPLAQGGLFYIDFRKNGKKSS